MTRKYIANPTTRWVIIIPVVGFTLLAVFLSNWSKSKQIDECLRYTIAYSNSIKNKKLIYSYNMMGREYTGFWRINPRSFSDVFSLYKENFVGRRLLLRVNCDKPEINEIDWTHSVPASVYKSPEAGWQVIPEDFPKTKFAD